MSETGKTIALIEALKGSGGGSSLPTVTSADNGKVLTVQDGAWAATSNAYIITSTNGKSDKTVDEIHDAINMGRTVFLSHLSVTYAYSSEDSSRICFLAYAGAVSNIKTAYITKSNLSVSATMQPQLPPSTSSDNGSELIVKNGAWTKQKKKFLVTLTPTAADYSGTMDKTVAEINAAYEAGQEIIFRVVTSASSYVEVPVSFRGRDTSFDYPNFGAEIVKSGANLMIVAQTGDTSDGTKATYSTTVYALTPAS